MKRRILLFHLILFNFFPLNGYCSEDANEIDPSMLRVSSSLFRLDIDLGDIDFDLRLDQQKQQNEEEPLIAPGSSSAPVVEDKEEEDERDSSTSSTDVRRIIVKGADGRFTVLKIRLATQKRARVLEDEVEEKRAENVEKQEERDAEPVAMAIDVDEVEGDQLAPSPKRIKEEDLERDEDGGADNAQPIQPEVVIAEQERAPVYFHLNPPTLQPILVNEFQQNMIPGLIDDAQVTQNLAIFLENGFRNHIQQHFQSKYGVGLGQDFPSLINDNFRFVLEQIEEPK